jgi:hypothetical protein
MRTKTKLAAATVATGLLVVVPATVAHAAPVTDDEQLEFGFTSLGGSTLSCTVNAYSAVDHQNEPADAFLYVEVLVEDDPGCREAAAYSTVHATYKPSNSDDRGDLGGSGGGWYATASANLQDAVVTNLQVEHRVYFSCRDGGGQPSVCEALVRTSTK